MTGKKVRQSFMNFYGRETERKKLKKAFQTDGQMITLIYGRRRIGKSELIRQVEQMGLACYKYGFFSRSGFDCEKKENRILLELEELYQ